MCRANVKLPSRAAILNETPLITIPPFEMIEYVCSMNENYKECYKEKWGHPMTTAQFTYGVIVTLRDCIQRLSENTRRALRNRDPITEF